MVFQLSRTYFRYAASSTDVSSIAGMHVFVVDTESGKFSYTQVTRHSHLEVIRDRHRWFGLVGAGGSGRWWGRTEGLGRSGLV